MQSKKAEIITTCTIFYISSPADETRCFIGRWNNHFLPPS